MIRLELSIRAGRGHASALTQALRAQKARALSLPGCLGGQLSRDLDDPATLYYAEHWDIGGPAFVWPADHVRRLLAIMETAAPSPTLAVRLISATHGHAYLETLLGGGRS